MKNKPIIKSKKYYYQGRIINMRYDEVIIEGHETSREIVEHPGGAAALAVMNNKIYFVRQYRHPYYEDVLEVPAGKLEVGEKPIVTIKRELSEEVGIINAKIEESGVLYPSPGYSNEVIHLFYTDDFTVSDNTNCDEDEFLDLVVLDIHEAYQLLDEGKIVDAKTLVLLHKYRNRIFKKI